MGHYCTHPIHFDDVVPHALRSAGGSTDCLVNIGSRASVCGSNVRCDGFDVILIYGFRIFLIGFDDGGVCGYSAEGWDNVGFEHIGSITCKGATNGITKSRIGRAVVENVGNKSGEDKNKQTV
jgi:hypothetical protein